ncbi:Outer envelope pore protein 16 [Nymphaea thermarum]|nr:Outer envelope pore protein 16 [Nymphaea thermarum]
MPTVDVFIDMGHPLLNRTVDGFLKIGAVGAARVAAEESYHCIRKGTVAGVYVGMEYGIERVRGRKDWKNAMIGGALTGALLSAAKNNNRDKIVADALTGGAIATASVFVNRLI